MISRKRLFSYIGQESEDLAQFVADIRKNNKFNLKLQTVRKEFFSDPYQLDNGNKRYVS